MNIAQVKAWLELMRVSNLPTVWSNALSGCAIGLIAGGSGGDGAAARGGVAFAWDRWAVAAVAVGLIYVAGMVGNDLADLATDRRERPGRPLPSGRVRRGAAMLFVVVACGVALGVLALGGMQALGVGVGLVACVVAYNAAHKLHPATIVLMGGCRALGMIAAATVAARGWPSVAQWAWLGPMAGGLGLYVMALSAVARAEAGDRGRIRVVVAMLCAISLLDAAYLLALGRPVQAGVAVVCFALAAWGQRRILGT